MKEKIENLDFNTLDENGVNELITSLLELNDEDLKESIINIIDKIELAQIRDDNIPSVYKVIFNNDKIKNVAENLLKEYNDDI